MVSSVHDTSAARSGVRARSRRDEAPSHPFQKMVGIERLDRLLDGARSTGAPLPHLLLIADAPSVHLAPFVAEIVARELDRPLHTMRCQEIASIDALLALLAETADGAILYLDNVDALAQLISDTLALALQTGAIEYVIDDEPGAPVHLAALPHLALIGAVPARALLGSALTPLFAEQIDVRALSVSWRTRVATQRARHAAVTASLDEVVALLTRQTRELVERRVVRGALRTTTSSVEVRGIQQQRRAIVSYKIEASRATGKEPLTNDIAEGMFVLDGLTGQAIESHEERYISDNAGALLRQARADEAPVEKEPTAPRPAMVADPLRAKALQRIIATHTEVVKRRGIDGGSYKRTYLPRPDDISINTVIVPIVTAEGVARVGDQTFAATWLVGTGASTSPFLLRTSLPDELALCEACGHVDNRDWFCLYCRRRACLHCAPPVFKQYCSRECYDQKQHDALLAKIDHADLRARVESGGQRLTQVVQVDHVCLALAAETAYLYDRRISEVRRDGAHSFQAVAQGIWPLRRWRLSAATPGRSAPVTLAVCADRERAELLATILGDWISPT